MHSVLFFKLLSDDCLCVCPHPWGHLVTSEDMMQWL